MSFSIRCLISVGEGWKRDVKWRVTSMTSWLCSKCFRLFMIRTMTASTKCFLSSSTEAGKSLPADAEGPSPASLPPAPKPSWPDRCTTKGTLTLKSLHSNMLLTWNASPSWGSLDLSLSLPPSFTKILALGLTYKLMRCRFNSSTGMFVCMTISCQDKFWWLLNNIRMHIWYVDTLSSCLDLPMFALMSAAPWFGCHVRRRPVCLAR
mmetsp:Transcript_47137/g.143270  ORF Transcript_47137/g.143270 Transcript_47137/m.143270 type:complete len:207 (-) Transcript_47137:1803-2423(-)